MTLSLQQLGSHRWIVPAVAFSVTTADGVRLAGTALQADDPARPALVLAHGLMGWHRKPAFARFAESLSNWFAVYAMDLRGHGASGGVTDYGGAEIEDVAAVVSLARGRRHERVATAGMSMGAISVIRHAALVGGSDAVVAISSLAWWDWHDEAHPRAADWMRRRTATPAGRAALRVWGVRLPGDWVRPESPEDVVAKIAPIPLVVVHGDRDGLFPASHGEALLAAAGEPKRLLLGRRGGHAEALITPGFAPLIGRVTSEALGVRWSG